MNEKLNKISKAAFIRLHPKKSPEEIVDLAAKAGVSIVASYVYNTRWNDQMMFTKRISKKSTIVSYTQPQPDKNRRSKKVSQVVGAATQSNRSQLMKLMIDVGLDEVMKMASDIRKLVN